MRASARCLCSAGCQISSLSSPLAPWAAAEPCCHPWETLPASGITQGSTHRGIVWGSAHPGTTQGSSQWPCCDAGLRASPGGLCLLSEVLLTFRLCQVFGLVCMALSGFPLPLLAVCCLPWEKTPSQICSPLFCFNSFLVGGHDSLLATQPCPSPSRTKGPKNNITG